METVSGKQQSSSSSTTQLRIRAVSQLTAHPLLARSCLVPQATTTITSTIQDSNMFERLSLEQIARVLECVELRPRLSKCALVCSSWRAAAAIASKSITCYYYPAMSPWLTTHTAAVAVTSISVTHLATRNACAQPLLLPVLQLKSLRSLKLDKVPWKVAACTTAASTGNTSTSSTPPAPAPSTPAALAPLTALTSLDLSESSVELHGLSALTDLQQLTLTRSPPPPGARALPDLFASLMGGPAALDFGLAGPFANGIMAVIPGFGLVGAPGLLAALPRLSGGSPPIAAEAALIAAMPRLQRLTTLVLDGVLASSAVVAHITCLQHLQRLSLKDTTVNSFTAFPQSITQLELQISSSTSATANRTTLDTTTARGIVQLTGLQSLKLRPAHHMQFDSAVLARLTNLTHLEFGWVEFAGGISAQLQVLSRLTKLQSLLFNGNSIAEPPVSSLAPADAAALTASSVLTCLHCSAGGQLLQQPLVSAAQKASGSAGAPA